MAQGIPIILDTDIGTDIDDTWALAMLLRSPELDLRLVTTATKNTTYRARIVAKLLEVAGRADVPIGIGPQQCDTTDAQQPWVEDYDISRYPGRVRADGIDAMVRTIMESPQPITLIAIGPLTNVAEALRREPRIADRARFVGMHGGLRRGYEGKPTPDAEYNVKANVPAARSVFTAPWDMTITPLDTCGIVRLTGERYRSVCRSDVPLARAVIENYRHWLRGRHADGSSILFDTVAIYLAFADDLLTMETLGVRVTDEGFTVIDPAAKPVHCATEWKDLAAFQDLLVRRLTSP